MSESRAAFISHSTSPSVSTILIFTVSAVCGSGIEIIGQDRDATLAFELAGVHEPIRDRVVLSVRPRLPEHPVHKRSLPAVDVGDDPRSSARSVFLPQFGDKQRPCWCASPCGAIQSVQQGVGKTNSGQFRTERAMSLVGHL